MRFARAVIISFVIAAFIASEAGACSAFRVTAKDGTIIAARTMEFGIDVHSSIAVIPAGKAYISPAPNGAKGLVWTGKYAFVGINVFASNDLICDGMNEAGFAMSALWYEPDMQWQTVLPGEEAAALASPMIGSWILGNFSTVAELKEAIPAIKVYASDVPGMGPMPPMHFIVWDAQGGAAVIEYEHGAVNVYDNPLGIMTNAPNFPWQMTNLRTYVGMSTDEKPAVLFDGVKLNPTGHGNGMIGLPGDITPPSRFVRMAVLLHYADKQADAKGVLNLAEHVVNSLDIILGTVVDRKPDGTIASSESTEWAVFRDLTHRILYYRTYDDLTIRKVDLSAIDLTKEATLSMAGSVGP